LAGPAAAMTGEENGAGDRDRTGDIQLGKVTIYIFFNYLQDRKSAERNARGSKGFLTAGVKRGLGSVFIRVSRWTHRKPLSPPLYRHSKIERLSTLIDQHPRAVARLGLLMASQWPNIPIPEGGQAATGF